MRIFRGERVVGCWEEDARALAAADVIVVIVRATLND